MIVEPCPEEKCAGLACPRRAVHHWRWQRTFGVSQRLEQWFPAATAREAALRMLVQDLELNEASGYATDLEGVKKRLPPGLRFEVHEVADDGTGQPALLALYSGDEDPMELLAKMPVWEEEKPT